MRALLLLAAALAFGCDDPDVSAKALDILEHGFVSARVECSCVVSDGSTTDTVDYTAHRTLDGACFATKNDREKSRLCARDESCAENCLLDKVSVSGGQISWQKSNPPAAAHVADISTCCTGFNLEAFGVE